MAERCFTYKKVPQSVDTERGNGYNISRVRPKRSADEQCCYFVKITVLCQQGGYLCRNFMIVIDSISCFSARMSAIINSSILHTSFRMVCWPPLALGIIPVNIIMLMYKFVYIIRKFPQSVDTERGNGYNTYRVRSKRSANNSWLFHLEDNRPDYGRAVIFCVSLLLWTWFRLKKQKEARITSTCATPPFGECADRRLPLVLYL